MTRSGAIWSSTNDILCQGAYPLFFLDYVGTGLLEPVVVSGLIEGCAKACQTHGLALLGGETAEMPGMYQNGDFDLVGFIVGAVERENILDGSRVRAGQRLIGISSDGLHTNGYSLARKLIFERFGLQLGDRPRELAGRSVQEALLAPHRCYLKALRPLIVEKRLAAWAHITGGGLPGNVNRVLGQTDAWIDRQAWSLPGLFQLLTRDGAVEREESYRAFNMGVGAVLLVEPQQVEPVLRHLKACGEQAFEMGEVRAGTGVVRFSS
jgi:phosphoribosylformylglycinamidine cyclo-ligase